MVSVAEMEETLVGGTHLELGIVVFAMNEMHYPREPALLLYRLLCLLCSSLDRSTWVSLCLLYAFSNQNLQYLQYTFEVLYCCNRGLVPHQTPCYLACYSSSGRVRL